MDLPAPIHDILLVSLGSGLIVGGYGVVLLTNPIYSAFSLVLFVYLSTINLFFCSCCAVIYVGAINVLILFAVMFMNGSEYYNSLHFWRLVRITVGESYVGQEYVGESSGGYRTRRKERCLSLSIHSFLCFQIVSKWILFFFLYKSVFFTNCYYPKHVMVRDYLDYKIKPDHRTGPFFQKVLAHPFLSSTPLSLMLNIFISDFDLESFEFP